MKVGLIAAAAVALAGCATTAKFEMKLNGMIGSSESRLVSEWGPPDSTYPMSDGSKILTYRRSSQGFVPGYQTATTTVYGNTAFTQVNGSPGVVINNTCRVDWTLGADGHLSSWRWEGNACRSR